MNPPKSKLVEFPEYEATKNIAPQNVAKFDFFNKAFGFSESRLESLSMEVNVLMNQCKLETIESGKKDISHCVSSKLIKKYAIKAGAVGSITSIPATLPIIGTIWTAVFGISADIVYLIRTQIELCYAIAFAYKVKIDPEELKAIVLALIGFSSSSELVREMTTTTLRNSVNEAVKKHLLIGLKKASLEIGEKISTRIMRKSYKLIPLVSIPVSASINIASVMMVGGQARRYFLACDGGL